MGIYKLDRIWYVRYRSPETGKVVRKSTGTEDKKLAKAIDADIKAKIAKRKFFGFVEPEEMLFEKLCERFLKYQEKRRRPRTVQRNRDSIKHLKESFAGRRLLTITMCDVEKFVDKRLDQPVSPRTATIDLITLKHMFRKAVEWGYLLKNPAEKVKGQKGQEEQIMILSDEEECRLSNASAEHIKSITKLTLLTGFRKGEVLKVRWNDVQWRLKRIVVMGTKVRKIRYIPINSDVYAFLMDLGPKSGDQFLFAKEDGSRYRDIKVAFNGACRRAGMPRFKFKWLRDTFAVRFLDSGGNIRALQMTLGHSSLEVTQKYLPLTDAQLLAEMEKMCKEHKKSTVGSNGK